MFKVLICWVWQNRNLQTIHLMTITWFSESLIIVLYAELPMANRCLKRKATFLDVEFTTLQCHFLFVCFWLLGFFLMRIPCSERHLQGLNKKQHTIRPHRHCECDALCQAPLTVWHPRQRCPGTCLLVQPKSSQTANDLVQQGQKSNSSPKIQIIIKHQILCAISNWGKGVTERHMEWTTEPDSPCSETAL